MNSYQVGYRMPGQVAIRLLSIQAHNLIHAARLAASLAQPGELLVSVSQI